MILAIVGFALCAGGAYQAWRGTSSPWARAGMLTLIVCLFFALVPS